MGSKIKDLEKYFREESEKEKEYAKALEGTAKKSNNLMLKVLMKAVSTDSMKHSSLYEAMAEILDNPQLISEKESEDVIKEIEEHIEEEREAVEELKRLLEDERIKKVPAVKFLVEMLLRDELYHHALLKRLHDAVIKPSVFNEEQYWEMVWKDSMWHGAPGG